MAGGPGASVCSVLAAVAALAQAARADSLADIISGASASDANSSATAQQQQGQSGSDAFDDEEPGVLHWILAAFLGAILVTGLTRVYRVLRRLNVMTTALRYVPEGMRAAECGACHQMQYVRTHGRIFICFCCHSANRLPREVSRSEQQLLVLPTGPLRSYEFKKGGENFWQEISREELPMPPEEAGGDTTTHQAKKLHYRGLYCIGCSRQACLRLNEFPEDQKVAYLPEAPADEVRIKAEDDSTEAVPVEPTVVGRKAEPEPDEEAVSIGSGDDNGLPQCVVCLDRPGCMVLLPCAHGSVCEECATRIAQNRATGGAHCPHCRSNIETLVKLHEVAGEVARGVEVRIPIARAL